MKTLVYAHRGASAYAPENTLEAFALACEMKADGIELDIHLTADGRLAVIHDPSVGRTSDGGGEVAAQTMAELKRYRFSAGFGDRYPNARMPELCEVYELVKPYGITVNVELKASGDAFLRAALRTEDAYGMNGRIIYSSFNHGLLAELIKLRPEAFTAPLYSKELAEPWAYAKKLGARAVHPHYSQLHLPENAGYTEKAHALGIRVHPWTVDVAEELKALYRLGVDAVITDKPDLALSVFKEERSKDR